MRESKKNILKIAVCSIVGVFTIFGIVFGLSFLNMDGLTKYLPYFFGVVLTLSVGLALYFLSIKPMRYFIKSRNFIKSRKMSKEEKVIHNIKTYMKQRKSRISGMTFILIFFVSIGIWMMLMGNKLAQTMTPEHYRVLDLTKLMIYQWHFFLFTGFIIGTLIMEIAGVTKDKHRLTLNMWERIQELEKEVKGLKKQAQADSQQIADVDGGDSASGVELQ